MVIGVGPLPLALAALEVTVYVRRHWAFCSAGIGVSCVDPAIQRSSDPAIQLSSDPAIQRVGLSFFALPTCLHATTASPTQRRYCDHIVPVVVLRVAHPVRIRVVDACITRRRIRCQRA